MKAHLFKLLMLAAFLFSCEDSTDTFYNAHDEATIQEVDMSDFYLRTDESASSTTGKNGSNNGNAHKCFTMNVLNRKLDENPGLYQKMYAIEEHSRKFIAAKRGGNGGGRGNSTPDPEPDPEPEPDPDPDPSAYPPNTIPVVFHVIYRTDSENIPNSQLQEQIDALNEDFNGLNPGRDNVPTIFSGLQSNVGVNFVIHDIIRKKNKRKRSWSPNDAMKFSSQGGSNVVEPQKYLNIWVVNNMPYQGGNILGYAQFPGGNWATDGIVLDHRFTGNTPYSLGRTATHEVGHWMNLRHIWGDGGCSQDDFVTDTPDSDRYNTGCPTTPPIHCGSEDMFVNFMDYSSDPCLNMFTHGQKDRMEPVFADGGFREAMGIDLAATNP